MTTTALTRQGHECRNCGWSSVKWVGRCAACQQWDSLVAVAAPRSRAPGRILQGEAAVPLTDVEVSGATAVPTGICEFDRVLGGGLVPGAVVLLAGEPGVGKSTLLLQVAAARAQAGATVLYVTGEESVAQVRGRAHRVGAMTDRVLLAAETEVEAVAEHVGTRRPDLLIVDSIQTMSSATVGGVTSGVTQVREAASALIRIAKQRELPCLIVGHVTKDGGIAGPRTLEHLVDVVLSFEGDRQARLRMVRAVKNRFGPTDEVGCFELDESGLSELADPSALFRSEGSTPVPGTCLTVALEGSRPLLAEVQALAVPTGGSPRRVAAGVDAARTAMVLAVLERRAGTATSAMDTYVAPVGGLRLVEPSADLPIALACLGSVRDLAMPPGWAAFGEVGLAGDVRRVAGARQRMNEAARLGVTDLVLPRLHGQGAGEVPLRLHEVTGIIDAIRAIPWSRPSGAGEHA